MKKLAVLAGVLALLMCGTSAWATTTSTLSGANGQLIGNGAFSSGILTYTVQQVGSLWDYDYTFTPSGTTRGPGAFDLEVGSGFNLSDITTWSAIYSTTGGNQTSNTVLSGPTSLNLTPQAPYNTNLSGSPGKFQSTSSTASSVTATIYGITFLLPNAQGTSAYDTTPTNFQSYTYDSVYGGSGDALTISLTSSFAPVWGNFFADGGDWTNNFGWLIGYNSNYNTPATQGYVDGTPLADYVPVPGVAPVPIPPSILLLGGGIGGLGLIRRKRAKG
jgi:hypothetical protein